MSADANSPDTVGSEDDVGLKMLNARKMVELRKKMVAQSKISEKNEKNANYREPSDREILLSALVDRGDEVLRSAETRYPEQMKRLIPAIVRLIRSKKIDKIRGGELLQFLRSLGLRVSVQTSISVEEHGKFVSLADKLKQETSDI